MTVSDGVAAGTREDESGKLLVDLLTEDGFEVQHRVVPDERPRIAAALRELAKSSRLVLTTGGTGVSQRDFTPEATASVIERPVPGIAEALRADATRQTPHGLLGRGVAGVRGRTLIVNLPGSTNGVKEGLAVLEQFVDHAVDLLTGNTAHTHG